jgi:hypothetical protein
MVALAACLLAFAPASAAVALSGNAAASATPSTDTSSLSAAGRHVDENDLDPAETNLTDDSGVRYYFSAEATLRPKGEKPGGEGPGEEPPGRGQSGGKSPSTTTTIPSTTTSPPTPTTTAPTSTTLPAASSDDGRSDDDSAAKTTGSISKPQVEAKRDPAPAAPWDQPTDRPGDEPSTTPTTAPPGSGDPELVESTVDTEPPTRERTALEWILLTGEDVSQPTPFAPVETLDSEPDTSTVVLSWLVERTSTGTSMAVLSPLVVLMTIWDAAASAGSGLAAPASGLGTLVLLVLVEKGHLVNGARLLRRRDEG